MVTLDLILFQLNDNDLYNYFLGNFYNDLWRRKKELST